MVIIKKFFKFIFDVVSSSKKDSIGAYTANAAFFITVSFVPFIMLLISILRFFPLDEGQMINQLASIFPATAKDLASTLVAESYENGGSAVISIAAVSTLWAASMGVHSLAKGIDRVYNAEKAKNIITLRFKSMLYTLAVFAVIIFWLALAVFGDNITVQVSQKAPWTEGALRFLGSLHNLWAMIVLCLFFLAMYTVIPSSKVRFIAQIPGAVIGGVGCLGISNFFTHYYEDILGFSSVYGGLTIIVFFMLWMYFCIYSLFIGAEVNKYMGSNLDGR